MTHDSLLKSLRQIEEGWERLGRTALMRLLRPGLAVARAREILGTGGLPSNDEVEILFGWHDGTDAARARSLDDIHFFPGFYLLSLDDAMADYRAFAADPRWSPGWLPMFANGGGDFQFVDLSGDLAGSVGHFRIDESEHPLEFESISAMLATVAAGFGRDVYFVDRDGYLEVDDLAFAFLAAEMNPRVPWWTD